MAVPSYSQYAHYIDGAAKRFGVDPRLIRGAMALENYGGDPALGGSSGEIGLMQVMGPTYASLAKQHGLGPDRADPENNILAGTAYLREGLDAGGGDWSKALAYYNAGPGGAGAFLKTGDFSSLPAVTQAHLQRGARLGLLDPTRTPPVEVAAPKPTMPVQETPAMAQTTPAPGLLFDATDTGGNAPTPPPASAPDGGGGWLSALAAGLMEFGNGLRGGAPGAGMNMLATFQKQSQQQASQQALAAAMQKLNGPNPDMKGALAILGANPATASMAFQMLPELEKMKRQQAQMQSAGVYADRLEAAGHSDLAAALRGNPSLMDEVVKHQASAAFPKQEAFTLAPGNMRFGPDGKVVASAPDAPSTDLVSVFDPATGQSTYRRKADAEGMTAPPPRGVTVNLNNGADTVAQRQALAESLGVPLAEMSPYDNTNLSAKGRENLFIANQKAAEKRWAAMGEDEAAHREMIANLGRFKQLNEKVSTGGLMGVSGVGAAAGLFDGDVAELRSITAKIAPNMRPPGSGATSDYDARQFERATVGIDKPKQANQNIADARIAAAQQALDRGAFERSYFDANGHLQGADRAWQRYANENPIFDPKGKEFALNPNRVGWRDYFRPKKEQAQPPSSTAGAELDFDPATGTFKPRAR